MHIPKCAGTTLRHALAHFDEATERYYDKGMTEHPVLGPLDYHHIPLAVLKEHFSSDCARFEGCLSFALVRDPFARFPSSLHERLIQRDRKPLNKRDGANIAREVDEALEMLSRHPKDKSITDPKLVYFSRQKDDNFLDERQIVQTVRTVDEVKEILGELFATAGRPIQPKESKNRRLHHTFPFVESPQKAITRPIEKALPRRVWKPAFKPVKAAFIAAGPMRRAVNPLAELPNANEIEAFVAEFYADDIHLCENANVARRVRTTTSKRVS